MADDSLGSAAWTVLISHSSADENLGADSEQQSRFLFLLFASEFKLIRTNPAKSCTIEALLGGAILVVKVYLGSWFVIVLPNMKAHI